MLRKLVKYLDKRLLILSSRYLYFQKIENINFIEKIAFTFSLWSESKTAFRFEAKNNFQQTLGILLAFLVLHILKEQIFYRTRTEST